MFNYTIKMKDQTKKINTNTLADCEALVINNLLSSEEDGSWAEIQRNGETVSIITKSKNSTHWKHKGYRFSI